MKRLSLIGLVCCLLMLTACGGGGGGGGGNPQGNPEGTNNPPVADAGADIYALDGATVVLDGSTSSDPDKDQITYLWEQLKENPSDPDVTFDDPTSVRQSFTADFSAVSKLTFRLTVTDSKGVSSSDTCSVIMNKPPVAIAADIIASSGATDFELDGSVSFDPDSDKITYLWKQEKQAGDPTITLADATSAKARFTADQSTFTTLTFSLTVTDSKGASSSAVCKVMKKAEIETQTQVQNILYAAYAGIGYGRATNYTDDAPLYDIMFDDLNDMGSNFVLDTIFNDSDAINKLLAVAVGGARSFTWSTSVAPLPNGVTSSSVYVSAGSLTNGYRSFSGTLSVKFNAAGYQLGNGVRFYGNAGVADADLTAAVTGYFKYSISDGTVYFYVRGVTIQAKNTLRAVYPLGEITYGASDGSSWKIAYTVYYGSVDPISKSTIPWNVQLMPVVMATGDLPTSDFRDYTLSGTFAINGNKYSFPSTGMRYRQWQYDYSGVTRYPLALNGTLQTPDVSSAIAISSPEDTTDPIGSGTILRSLTGIWTSGQMSIGKTTKVNASFNNGVCDFTGDLGPWSVSNWQNVLKP